MLLLVITLFISHNQNVKAFEKNVDDILCPECSDMPEDIQSLYTGRSLLPAQHHHCINETMPFTLNNNDVKFQYAIYPGSLIMLDRHFPTKNPKRLDVERKQLGYIVDLPGMNKSFQIEPHWADYYVSLDNVIKSWFDTKKYYGRVSNRRIFVQNKDQLSCEFDNKIVSWLDINYEAIEKGEQLSVVYQVFWTYYKVDLNSTFHASDIYGSSVTKSELASKRANANYSTKMVTSASYGITFYLVLTTSIMSPQAHIIMKEGHENAYQYLSDLKMKVAFIEGGSIGFKSFLLRKKTIQEVRDTMNSPWKPFKLREARLISYTMKEIKDDGLPSEITTTTEYLRKPRNRVLQLKHIGKYRLKLYIQWEEISWDEQGNEVLTKKFWGQNDFEKKSIVEEIIFSDNSKNLMIKAWSYMNSSRIRRWKKFFDKKHLVPQEYKEFLFGGEENGPSVTIYK